MRWLQRPSCWLGEPGTASHMGHLLNRRDVEKAAAVIWSVLEPTPLQFSGRLSQQFDRSVWFKREDLQPVRSYKGRGVLDAVTCALDSQEGVSQVVCVSAGNHTQGVVWVCARLGIPATIVVPARTPRQKRDRIEAIGAGDVELQLVAGLFKYAAVTAAQLVLDSNALLVSPFDHPDVIAGQGVVTIETLDQLGTGENDRLTLVVPVGGGGLAAGCRTALSSTQGTCTGWNRRTPHVCTQHSKPTNPSNSIMSIRLSMGVLYVGCVNSPSNFSTTPKRRNQVRAVS